MYLKNVKGEVIDTKEKAIKALIHTANYEQIPVSHLWCFEEQCKRFIIDGNNFYKQEMCDECKKWGIGIFHYKDEDFEYRYPWTCC